MYRRIPQLIIMFMAFFMRMAIGYIITKLQNIGVNNSFAVLRILVYNGGNRIAAHENGNLTIVNIEEFILNG
jgi:hypothetical protein